MLFRNTSADSSWPYKTMSVMIAARQKTIRDRLLALPSKNLFDSECTDADAEALFSMSWYAEDRPIVIGEPPPGFILWNP